VLAFPLYSFCPSFPFLSSLSFLYHKHARVTERAVVVHSGRISQLPYSRLTSVAPLPAPPRDSGWHHGSAAGANHNDIVVDSFTYLHSHSHQHTDADAGGADYPNNNNFDVHHATDPGFHRHHIQQQQQHHPRWNPTKEHNIYVCPHHDQPSRPDYHQRNRRLRHADFQQQPVQHTRR